MEDAFLGDLAIKSRYRRCRASSTGSFSNSSPFNFRHAYTAARSIHVDILKWTTRCMLFGAYRSPPLVPLDAHEPSIIYRTFPPYFYLSYDWRSRWPTGGVPQPWQRLYLRGMSMSPQFIRNEVGRCAHQRTYRCLLSLKRSRRIVPLQKCWV
ncbi:hypothetical protein GW17_00048591 [Ensete ventricosum]|nr:hypothetical protein GW17_00048591 [Ensete ventricosum]